jgi:hypothetical protein
MRIATDLRSVWLVIAGKPARSKAALSYLRMTFPSRTLPVEVGKTSRLSLDIKSFDFRLSNISMHQLGSLTLRCPAAVSIQVPCDRHVCFAS